MAHFLEGFDESGDRGGRLAGLLGEEFEPDLARNRRRRGVTRARNDRFSDPRFGERSVTEGSNRILQSLFEPGGQIASGFRNILGGGVKSGFGTQGGDLLRQFTRQTSNTLGNTVGRFIGESLPGLFEGARSSSDAAAARAEEADFRLRENLFTGLSGAESLRLAEGKKGIFGLGLGPF